MQRHPETAVPASTRLALAPSECQLVESATPWPSSATTTTSSASPRDADDAEIKRAFRRLAQQHHPDVDTDDGAEERFKELNEAYRVLSDRQRRAAYDMFGHAGVEGRQLAVSRASVADSGHSATSSTRSSADRQRARVAARGSSPAPTSAMT